MNPLAGVAAIEAIDVHAEGEPGRVVLADALDIRGETMAERLTWCKTHLDPLRTLLLHEPRGYPALCAILVVPPVSPSSHAGIIVLEQGGFKAMSGSNTMCAVTALLESGVVPTTEPETIVRLDTAAGPVEALARVSGGRVTSVRVFNVPSFVVGIDVPIEVKGIGTIPADITFGGQFYVQAAAQALGVGLGPEDARDLVHVAMGLLACARRQLRVQHPITPELDQINLVMLHAPAHRRGLDGRGRTVLPNRPLDADDPSTWRGTLDRSPCGTGTSARMACLHGRGELGLGQTFVNEGVLGTTFTGMLHQEVPVGDRVALLPSIEGRVWVIGENRLRLDPSDPFPAGYTVADIWGRTEIPMLSG